MEQILVFGKKPRVKEVQDGVLDTSYILVYRHPIGSFVAAEGSLVEMGVGIPEKIPGGIHKSIHGVRLPPGGS